MKDLANSLQNDIAPDTGRPEVTGLLMRGVCRGLSERGYATLTEFSLGCGRRADVIALDPRGEIVIVEVKSGPEDYRSDQKWQDYLDYCDRFLLRRDGPFPQGFAAGGLRPAGRRRLWRPDPPRRPAAASQRPPGGAIRACALPALLPSACRA